MARYGSLPWRLGRRWFIAVSALLPLLFIAQPLCGQDHRAYGVVTSIQFLQNGGATPGLNRLTELGAGSVRVEIPWDAIQHNQGQAFDFTSQMDGWVLGAINSGLDVFLNLGTPPSWGAPCTACVPYSMEEWYQYVRAVVERYSGYHALGNRVRYGIWNEPNDKHFLRQYPWECDNGQGNCPQDASVYQPLVTYAMHARDDSGTGAGFALPDCTASVAGNAWSGWFNYFYTALEYQQLLAPQDVIAVHWYHDDSPSLDDTLWSVISRTNREVWLTETGANSGHDVAHIDYLVNHIANRPGYLQNWTRFFYYRLFDDGTNEGQLLDGNWQPRPVFLTYKALINPPYSGMNPDSAVRNCNDYWDPGPVYQPSPDACLDYCAANNGDACEWEESSGGCWVEYGWGCTVEPGFSGWQAYVFNSPTAMSAEPQANGGLYRHDPWRNVRFGDEDVSNEDSSGVTWPTYR